VQSPGLLCHPSGFCGVGVGSPGRSGVVINGLAVEPVPGSVAAGPCPVSFCSSAVSECLPVTSPVLSGSAHSLSVWRRALFLPSFHKQLDCSVCLFLLPIPSLREWIKVISLRCSWRGDSRLP